MLQQENKRLFKITTPTRGFFLTQRAKQYSLQAVDSKFKYFRVYASIKKKKNLINQFQDNEDNQKDWLNGPDELL